MRSLHYIGMLAASAVVCVAAASTAAADFPKGTFTRKGPDAATWSVRLDGKDQFKVTRDGKEGVAGTYKVVKDTIEFTDESGPFAEKGAVKTGTYQWRLADQKLTLTKVKDEAKGRSAILASGDWEMKE